MTDNNHNATLPDTGLVGGKLDDENGASGEAPPPPPPATDGTQNGKAGGPPAAIRNTAAATTTTTEEFSPPKLIVRKGSKNAGTKKGSKRTEFPQSFWYRLCQIFERGAYKTQTEFLRSADSGPDVSIFHRMHFSRAYKKYLNGALVNCEESRCRKRKYECLEKRVIEYWTLQQHLLDQEEKQLQVEEQIQQQQQALFYDGTPATAFPTEEYPPQQTAAKRSKTTKKGKSPLAWSNIQQLARGWAKEMGFDDGFQASAGWIDNVLKRHQRGLEALKTRASLDDTVTQRRNWADYTQRKEALQQELQRADQVALIDAKGLRVGDRVNVLDVSHRQQQQQTGGGDLVITQIHKPPPSLDNNNNKLGKRTGEERSVEGFTYVTVERKRHGSTQTFPIQDVRRVVKAQEEDVVTIRQLLQPGLDSYQTAVAHFPKMSLTGARVLRPLWEDSDNEQMEATMTTKMRLQYSDTSCAEKINVQALRSHVLPQFRRDQKNRTKFLEELRGLSQRTKAQQDVLDKLLYAQMTHDMAKDLLDLVQGIPTKSKSVVYQVDYQPLDASMRGRLFALHPAPLPPDASLKSYAPRPLTLQAMPRDLRNALVASFAHWIKCDESDMAVGILCSLAGMAQATSLIPSWLDYRQHATAWNNFIRGVHDGISPAQAQLLPKVLLQGGTYETWKQAMEEQTEIAMPSSTDESLLSLQTFIVRLTTEWRALRDLVVTLPQYAWVQLDKAALLASHDYAPATIPNISMVRIMQACEREIWTSVSNLVQSQGWIVRAKLIDGLLVEAPSLTDSFSSILALAEKAVKSRGWGVGLVEGECYGKFSGHNKAPLAMLQEARRAMEELQEEMDAVRTAQVPNDNTMQPTAQPAIATAEQVQPPTPNILEQNTDQGQGSRPSDAQQTTEELERRATNGDLLFVPL
ncbi:expressed unknown protein [Seminavis robusta]|uniref:Uncharacterized protein n=1 Tax=Seminavis robusta TaxID=568900 RepID=A0A9N8DMY6_9STRA|nr:expressed unknown protein [Seminavis robusta]|eukprot:Sro167_g074560.1 n/a (918) ;mRNA; f:73650-76492